MPSSGCRTALYPAYAFTGIEPTGRHINHKQVHIFSIVDGQITHHRAVRDDLGLLLQLGWRPGGLG